MSARPASWLLIAGVFLTGAAGGAYLALRGQGDGRDAVASQPTRTETAQPAPALPTTAPVSTPGTVQESEGVIAEEAATPGRTAAAVERPRSEPRDTPRARERGSAPSAPRPITDRATATTPRAGTRSTRDTTPEAGRSRGPVRPTAPADGGSMPAADASARSQSDPSVRSLPAPSEPSPVTEAPLPAASLSVEPAPLPAIEPPRKVIEELVVSADSVIGLQIETPVTSERARIEDRVEARVTRDVTVGGEVAIAAGSRMLGSITLVEKGGKVKERARLGIRFHTLVLGDGTQLPVKTETVYREGESPAAESAAKIGGAAIGGAILGAIFGGTKGAVMGGAAGAAGGTAATMSGDRNAATLPAGSTLTVRLSAPVTVTVEK